MPLISLAMKNCSFKLKSWLLAARPKTLWASVAPVLLGVCIAGRDGHFQPLTASIIAVTALLIQIATNFANDYYDYKQGADTEARQGPLRAVQSGLIEPKEMLYATGLLLLLAFLLGIYLASIGGLPIVLIGSLALILSVLYTSGPFALAYLGLGDIAVLIFFGPVAVAGTHYLISQQWSSAAIFAGFGPGLISTAILCINNLRDRAGDLRAGKRTLAVRFGEKFARTQYFAMISLAALLPIVLAATGLGPLSVALALVAFLPFLTTIRQASFLDGAALNDVLVRTGQLLALYSFCLSFSWLL